MLALEVETCRRCFPAQPALSALQRCNRFKCAFFLRDLAAAADLPPHGALFSQQLLTLRGWTERADTDIDINDLHPLAAAVYIHNKLHSEGVPGPAPLQLPDPLLPAHSLTDLFTATAALLARRHPHSAPFLHSAWTVQQVITEEYRSLESVHNELGTPTPAAWIQVFEKRLCLLCQQCQQHGPQTPRSRSLWCIRALPTSTSQISHSLWSPGPVALGALRGFSRACSGSVSRLLEHASDNAAVARFVSSGACLLALSPILIFRCVPVQCPA